MEKRFQGTYTAIITPFTEHDTIDWKAFGKLIEKQIAGGVEGIVFVGTTGESPTLSYKEHEEILRWSVEKVAGRCKVIHGTGSNNTRESMAFAKVAADSGADAHLVINPYYNRPTSEGLYRHFKAIADVVDLPVIMYNIQGRTAVNLDTNTLLRLAEHRNIVGVKEASGNIGQMMDVIRRTNSDFCVLVGDDTLTLPFMACGGDGLISVVSNCLPRTTSTMVRDCLAGKWDQARDSFYNILDVMNVTMLESNPIPVKTMMAELGYCNSYIRLPLCEPSDLTYKEIQKAVALIRHLEK